MNKKWLAIPLLAGALLISTLGGCTSSTTVAAVPSLNQQTGIWVSGAGKVSATPDIAVISVGVSSQEATVADAQAKAADAMNKVMDVLTSNGIAKTDIQTQNFNITRVTRYDKETQQEVVIGYLVKNTVTAKIRQLDKTGPIIDAAAAAGGDLTRINSIYFDIEDQASFQSQAREKAMNDAKAKAQQLANLADVKLGKPNYVSESIVYPGPIYKGSFEMAAPSAAPAPTPISPGQLDISVTVQVTYSIE